MSGTHEQLRRQRNRVGYQLPDGRHLTPNEFAVAKLLSIGAKTAEVAQVMGIRIKTIDTHRAHVLKKLGLRNNAELVLWAVRRGVVKVELDPDVVIAAVDCPQSGAV